MEGENVYDQADISTRALHMDAHLAQVSDVAPALTVSTTYRYPKMDDLLKGEEIYAIYSREGHPLNYRTEAVLSSITRGQAVTYASGLASSFASFVHCSPKRVAIRDGYHGTHGALEVYRRSNNVKVIDIDDPLQQGDLLWIESPLNPTGEVVDLKHYADRAHAAGAIMIVDSTFGPPPLQNPFEQGADIVMHSASKYFGGHSDLLAGILVFKTKEEADRAKNDRTYLGSVLGNMETWLLLRSARTLKVRVLEQSKTATELVSWLFKAAGGKEYDGIPENTIAKVHHASIQHQPGSNWKPRSRDAKEESPFDPKVQMPGGFGPTFSILMCTPVLARHLPDQLNFFHHATSLGGVESLIELRSLWLDTIDKRLLRISVGLEDIEDLKNDFRQAFRKVHEKVNSGLAK